MKQNWQEKEIKKKYVISETQRRKSQLEALKFQISLQKKAADGEHRFKSITRVAGPVFVWVKGRAFILFAMKTRDS